MSSLEKADENPVPGPSSSKSGSSKKLPAKKAQRYEPCQRVLTVEEKYKVMKALSKGKKHAEVAQLFDPPLSQLTVATIAKNEKQIISAYEGGMFKSKRKDKAPSEWFKKVRDVNASANGPLLAEKARYFAKQLDYGNVQANSGFLDRFK